MLCIAQFTNLVDSMCRTSIGAFGLLFFTKSSAADEQLAQQHVKQLTCDIIWGMSIIGRHKMIPELV